MSSEHGDGIAVAQLVDDSQRDINRYQLRYILRNAIGYSALAAARSFEEIVRLARPHFVDIDASVGDVAFCETVLAQLDPERRLSGELEAFSRFVSVVFNHTSLPLFKRDELVAEALHHLGTLENLIAFYERESAVQAFLDGVRGRNHSDHVRIEFYKRCLAERQSIARYLTTGVHREAVERTDDTLDFARAFLNDKPKEPFRLRSPGGAAYLDFRQIDRWRHRLRFLPAERRDALATLHTTNPDAYVQELERVRPVQVVLDAIEDTWRRVARLQRRLPIAREMRRLWVDAHWYGLFALALPQVEGLFSEMCELGTPKAMQASKTLVQKVNWTRQYALEHEEAFDYFEFVLPELRNSFAHTGAVERPRDLAIDVLHDLAYICDVCLALQVPVMDLLRLLTEPSLISDPRPEEWARMFGLLRVIQKQGQQHEVEGPLQFFIAAAFASDDARVRAAHDVAEALESVTDATAMAIAGAVRARSRIDFDPAVKRDARIMALGAEIVAALTDLEEYDDEIDIARPLHLGVMAEGLVEHLGAPAVARSRLEQALSRVEVVHKNLKWLMELAAKEVS